jgi:hypothetical protein
LVELLFIKRLPEGLLDKVDGLLLIHNYSPKLFTKHYSST